MEYVVVFGCPRSGTTYLQGALRRLRGVETRIGNFIPVAIPHVLNRDVPDEQYEALCGSLRRAINIYLSGGVYNSRFQALAHWWYAPDQWQRLRHVVRKGRRAQPHAFVYKEPFFSLAPEFAFDALPEAQIIYIYRDGRDVANSLAASYDVLTDEKLTDLESAEMRLGRPYDHRYVPWWVAEGRDEEFIESSPYVRAIWMWTYMAERCRSHFETLSERDSERLLQVKYEDFMHHPHRVGEQLLTHVGTESSRAFRRHLDGAHTASIGKHRRRPQEEVEAAQRIAHEPLEALGYL